VRSGLIALFVLMAATQGCKRNRGAAGDAGGAAGGGSCPSPEKIAEAFKAEGRAVRSRCEHFPIGNYWLIFALTYDQARKADPRLALVSGGPAYGASIFDVEPAPVAAIEKLLQSSESVDVTLRSDRNLLRIGVMGSRGGAKRPEADEVILVLQRVAHSAPRLLFSGMGDQIAVEGGCVSERQVRFEMLFGTRLEMTSMRRVRPLEPGTKPPGCEAGPGMQESIDARPLPLKKGRTFAALDQSKAH
jgi:hypothetical protein